MDADLSREVQRHFSVTARKQLAPASVARLVTAHLARSNAAGLIDPLHPANCGADRNPELLGGLIAGHPALDRGHDTLAKIQRIRLAHPCWPPPSQHGESETH
jgi:hypothetical protein